MNGLDINELLAKHFSGEQISSGQQKELDNWIENNKDEYQALLKIIREDDSAINDMTFSTNKAWEKVNAKIKIKQGKKLEKKRIINIFYKASAVAASLMLFISLGLYYKNANKVIQVTADASNIKTVVLPDNSIVCLNKNSRIEYKKRFKKHRDVKLYGEAFFEVSENKKSPFTVQTDIASVRVLGTSFNVKAYKDSDAVVSVRTGHVEVLSGGKKVDLVKGESVRISNGEFVKQQLEDVDKPVWMKQELTFNNTPLKKLFKTLEEYYNIEITVNEDIDINNYSVTTEFSNETPEQAFEELKLILHFEYVQNGNSFYITNIKQIL